MAVGLQVLYSSQLADAAPVAQDTYKSFSDIAAGWKTNNCSYPDSAFYEEEQSPLGACRQVLPSAPLNSTEQKVVLSQQLCTKTVLFTSGVCSKEEGAEREKTLAALSKVNLVAAAEYDKYDVCWFAAGLKEKLATWLPEFMLNSTQCQSVCTAPGTDDTEKINFAPVCQFYVSTMCKFVEYPLCVNPDNPKPSE